MKLHRHDFNYSQAYDEYIRWQYVKSCECSIMASYLDRDYREYRAYREGRRCERAFDPIDAPPHQPAKIKKRAKIQSILAALSIFDAPHLHDNHVSHDNHDAFNFI